MISVVVTHSSSQLTFFFLDGLHKTVVCSMLMKTKHLSSLLISIFCAVALASTKNHQCDTRSPCGCSIREKIVGKIVGGESIAIESWSWTVSLLIDDLYLCGGTILSEFWILTAAHCVDSFQANQIKIHAASDVRWSGTQIRTASRIFIHPAYNLRTFVRDIALLFIDTPLEMNDYGLVPICLFANEDLTMIDQEWPPVNTQVVALGWGRLSENGPISMELQKVHLQVIDRYDESCSAILNDWRSQFCAGVPQGGKDTCQGDSGGPLLARMPDHRWVLAGITSFGYGCARAQYSGVYTRVASLMNWVSATTNQSFVLWNHSTSNKSPDFFCISVVLLSVKLFSVK